MPSRTAHVAGEDAGNDVFSVILGDLQQ